MTTDLEKLTGLIVQSVSTIVQTCNRVGKEFPSLDRPIEPSEFSPDGIRNNPAIAESIGLAVAAATQLIATLTPPPMTLLVSACRWTLPAALSIAEGTHVAEIIRESGPKGMHVDAIAARNGVDAKKLSHVLRYLATNHWFKEVEPDVFAHNLLSSLLDTGKDYEQIKQDVASKHVNTPGLAAAIGFGTDECMKAGAWMFENITDPVTGKSEEPQHASVCRAFQLKEPIWNWWEQPENIGRLRRFGAAMSGTNKMQPPQTILSAFDWGTVPKGGVVVDVGGGFGHVSLEVAKIRPDLKIVVEDRPPVAVQAKPYWEENLPQSVATGNVSFIGLDFFDKQPALPGTPDVFILRQIVHDWSDKYVIKLLKNLRSVATTKTKLLVIDTIIEYACKIPKSSTLSVKGLETPIPPEPLLPNLGGANLTPYTVDLVVMNTLNSGERTIGGFIELFNQTGWKLVEVRRSADSKIFWPCIIAEAT